MPYFNVRVYGLLLNEQDQLLVCDEWIRGALYTKFPGGGLEYGEGTRDCLIREFMEEMNLKIRVDDHLYTTDFFQASAFHPDHQIISIYYLVSATEELGPALSAIGFDYDPGQQRYYHKDAEIESFRFIARENIGEASVSLPIDKVAVQYLLQKK